MKNSLIVFFVLISASLHAETDNKTQSGEEIFTTFCADACHQAPDRSRLRPSQWRVVLNTMQTRMQSAGMVPLSDEQNKQVLEFLSQGQ